MTPRAHSAQLPTLDPREQMTVEEFLAFTEQRPDGERWELIEGVAILQASPSKVHQIISSNIVRELGNERKLLKRRWLPLLGVGTRVPISPNSLPQPDAFVLETPDDDEAAYDNTTTDALVLFEVISRSNTRRDQAWRRRVYASIPNCQHYVTVHQRRIEVVRYDREADWEATNLKSIDSTLELSALGAALPLAQIYADTPLAKGRL